MLARVAVDMNSSITASFCKKTAPLVPAEILIRAPSQHRYCRCAVLVIAVIINDISGIGKIAACQWRPVIVFHSGKDLTGLLVKGGKKKIPFLLISERHKWSKLTGVLDIEGDF